MDNRIPNLPAGHPHGEMRRDEREITDQNEIEEIIQSSRVMYLALADNNVPFLVPVFYAGDSNCLYFHSAKGGSKMDILKKNNLVCFAISVDQGVIPDELICNFEAKHRTVIGVGNSSFVEDVDEKIAVLDKIVAKFTDKHFDYPKANLQATRVVRIDVTAIKGKKHGF
jgi:nitroimidazol reductase NimA-like FMN-containing flavoprotein (pyridoxamine 5'-phosphate oxidase superfamily)